MKRKKNFILQNVAGELLLVPIGAQVIDLNGLVTLNSTGAFVWELLASDRTAEEITVAVAENFDVAPDSAAKDVNAFLNEISDMGLLEK